MNRRKFLQRTSALGVLGGLAGCTSDANDQNGTDGSGGGTGGDTPTETATPEPVSVTDESIETVSTDCRSDEESTHSVETDEDAGTVTITGTIVTPNPCYEAVLGSLEYDRDADTLTVIVDADSTDGACATCVGVVEYEATVEFAGGLPGSVDVSHAEPQPAGGTPGGPSLRESSLTVIDVSQSATRTTSDVKFNEDENTIVVTGTIEGSDGCKTAALGNVTHDRSEDHLSVDVVTTDREDADGCTQALVYIDYEATLSFEGGIPSSVSVSHDGRGVMSAGYGSASASAPDDENSSSSTPDDT